MVCEYPSNSDPDNPYSCQEVKTFSGWNAEFMDWLDDDTLIWPDAQAGNTLTTFNVITGEETALPIAGNTVFVGR